MWLLHQGTAALEGLHGSHREEDDAVEGLSTRFSLLETFVKMYPRNRGLGGLIFF